MMATSDFDMDLLIGLQLAQELEELEELEAREFVAPQHRTTASSSRQPDGGTPVDPELELIDPNPDLRALFLEFDRTYFWGRLSGVTVDWSRRMTRCAGICCYQRGGLCSIRLSEPLLKLRPRSDMVNTLLHEMIHAFLFVTRNNKDRDGHGPCFQEHMHRINAQARTNITVYHTFHDEVEANQQHWWQCNGPCRQRPPFFGLLKRATNRKPGSYDFWWAQHQRDCGGTYVKIKEPDNYGKKRKLSPKPKKSEGRDIRSMLSPPQPKPSSSAAANPTGKPAPPTLSSFVSSANSAGNTTPFPTPLSAKKPKLSSSASSNASRSSQPSLVFSSGSSQTSGRPQLSSFSSSDSSKTSGRPQPSPSSSDSSRSLGRPQPSFSSSDSSKTSGRPASSSSTSGSSKTPGRPQASLLPSSDSSRSLGRPQPSSFSSSDSSKTSGRPASSTSGSSKNPGRPQASPFSSSDSSRSLGRPVSSFSSSGSSKTSRRPGVSTISSRGTRTATTTTTIKRTPPPATGNGPGGSGGAVAPTERFPGSGVALGGSERPRSRLLDLYATPAATPVNRAAPTVAPIARAAPAGVTGDVGAGPASVQCPSCGAAVLENDINAHLDRCLR